MVNLPLEHSAEISETLPLGHELYVNFVEKILTEPDKEIIVPLFQ